MKVDPQNAGQMPQTSLAGFAAPSKDFSFASQLAKALKKPEVSAPIPTHLTMTNPTDNIRDIGFQAYAETIREEKLKELREKILQAMGLNEEALSKMPADQRAAIEKLVSEEIERRMAASTIANSDDQKGMIQGAKTAGEAGLPQSGQALSNAVNLGFANSINAFDAPIRTQSETRQDKEEKA